MSVLVDIGADVNGGEEPDTPICLAVQSKKKMMVEFLLQQGVNNVHRYRGKDIAWMERLVRKGSKR